MSKKKILSKIKKKKKLSVKYTFSINAKINSTKLPDTSQTRNLVPRNRPDLLEKRKFIPTKFTVFGPLNREN